MQRSIGYERRCDLSVIGCFAQACGYPSRPAFWCRGHEGGTKNGKDRELPVPLFLGEAFRDYCAQRPAARNVAAYQAGTKPVSGGPGEVRTLDLMTASHARSQLRHRPFSLTYHFYHGGKRLSMQVFPAWPPTQNEPGRPVFWEQTSAPWCQ